ncbi:MAG: lysine--tRNA ligase [archaeon]|nr:MAG: lysine--tRNA ligase [archaeon]
MHWADGIAKSIVKKWGDLDVYILEGGIAPSARKHIGSFREIVTGFFVKKALEDLGKKARFIYSWDSFDRLKKVSASIPEEKKKELEKYVGVPQGLIPDPFGCHKSYAEHFQEFVEKEAESLGVKPDFIYEDEEYRNCVYWKLISKVMKNREKIRVIINKYRDHEIEEGWWPVTVYCEKCNNGDDTEILDYDGKSTIDYECGCGHKGKMDFSKVGMIKPTWRVDWAMRWFHYGVNFEPSGKDHMVAGSSYETSSEIVKEIFGREPPLAKMYEFVGRKGDKGKMSASVGNIVTATDVMEIYPDEIILYFFAGTKPNKLFNIPFDEEVLKVYEDFYFCERIYFGLEDVSERDADHWKRVYELSVRNIPEKIPVQIPLSFLSLISQIYDDVDKVEDLLRKTGHIKEELGEHDKKRLKVFMEKARNWVKDYAPDNYKINVRETVPSDLKMEKGHREALLKLAEDLKKEWTAEDLQNRIYELGKGTGDVKGFFQVLYLVLIGRKAGPKAGQFIIAIGKDRVIKILEQLG